MIARTLLQDTAAAWHLQLAPHQLDQFEQYAAALIQWNTRTNLTTITDSQAITVRHFLDSLSIARAWLHEFPDSIIDIGSGAGFPGLPLKILWPTARLVLVESVGKKTEFLAHITEQLGLANVEIRTERAEALGQDLRYREQFALVTARAVAALNVLAEYCLPLCQVNGLFVAPKSEGVREVELAQNALQTLGGNLEATIDVELPGVEPRKLLVVRKVHVTPAQYPRRVGVPSKRPL